MLEDFSDRKPSVRAQVVTRRTYNRPTNEEGTTFETWEETVERVVGHQRWLWERAQGKRLFKAQNAELEELKSLLLKRKGYVAGRTLWLGGTEVAKRREACQFNCSYTNLETVQDAVDILWLLMQGCGVGFTPVVGSLSGFSSRIPEIEVIRSTRTDKGIENNQESYDPEAGVWIIKIGDSAEAWAKSVGKLLSGKHRASKLILDFSEIRPAGTRLKGYGWISSGDETIHKAWIEIATLLNRRASQLLDEIDLLDLANWMGTVLSSRRSAEIALLPYGNPNWERFAKAKDKWWEGNPQRQQSNNSLVFEHKPSREELSNIFSMMIKAGGSEPGFINMGAARARAPWVKGLNPCAEILLANKGFCNLVTMCLPKFNGDFDSLLRATWIMARANYRQTLVNLDDGILQNAWHQNNEFLRLCGVSLTGIVAWTDYNPYNLRQLRGSAVAGAFSMADELNMQRPKNVTTGKPEGTGTKTMGVEGFEVPEGAHKPLGRYILNTINFSKHDPLVANLRASGYKAMENPSDPSSVLITLPVEYKGIDFDKVDGKEVNMESALTQLERYKTIMLNYCDQNQSITVSYSPDEAEGIIDWLLENWDNYVGVSFLFRNDPTKTAKDLGYLYLPQDVVDKETYDEYVAQLFTIDVEGTQGVVSEVDDSDCVGGVCPVR